MGCGPAGILLVYVQVRRQVFNSFILINPPKTNGTKSRAFCESSQCSPADGEIRAQPVPGIPSHDDTRLWY